MRHFLDIVRPLSLEWAVVIAVIPSLISSQLHMGADWKGGSPGDVVLRHRYGFTLPWDGLAVLGGEAGVCRTGDLATVPMFPSHGATPGVTVGRCSCLTKCGKHLQNHLRKLGRDAVNDRHPAEQVGLLTCALQIPSLVLVQETLLVFLLLLIFCLPPHNKRSSDYL